MKPKAQRKHSTKGSTPNDVNVIYEKDDFVFVEPIVDYLRDHALTVLDSHQDGFGRK